MAVLQLWVNIPKMLLYNVHGLLLLLIPSLLAGQWCCRELADRRRRKPRDNTVDSLVHGYLLGGQLCWDWALEVEQQILGHWDIWILGHWDI